MKRHTCVICKKKRIEIKMSKVFLHSWACNYNCVNNKEIIEAEQILFMIDWIGRVFVIIFKGFKSP